MIHPKKEIRGSNAIEYLGPMASRLRQQQKEISITGKTSGLQVFNMTLQNFVTTARFLRLISTSIKSLSSGGTKFKSMSFFRVLLAILFPPLAVLGKGCGSFLIVLLLTFCGWVPGVIAALVILNNPG